MKVRTVLASKVRRKANTKHDELEPAEDEVEQKNSRKHNNCRDAQEKEGGPTFAAQTS